MSQYEELEQFGKNASKATDVGSTTSSAMSKAKATIATHFPDETIPELMKRVQEHLSFLGGIPEKFLSFSPSQRSAAPVTAATTPVYTPTFRPMAGHKPEAKDLKLEKIKAEMVSQITAIKEGNKHLEPTLHVASMRNNKP